VILDIQAVQSADYPERGIARHALGFVQALWEAHPELVGAILLNPDLPVPATAERKLKPLQDTGKLGFAGSVDVSAGRIYHVISPFELSVPLQRIWPASMNGMWLVVTLHDLIPEVYPAHYLADAGLRRRYRIREELVRAADHILAVSEATRDEAVARLGLEARRVTVIGAGISEEFHPAASRDEALRRAQTDLPSLEAGFILYVGGTDHRKNLEGLLDAYALLPPSLRDRHQLVIACRMGEADRAALVRQARRLGVGSRLYLPGYVPDPVLLALYQATALFVFPSLYEGYGLPVVEAMACGAPTVSSNTSALATLTHPLGQFDPTDPAAMAETMRAALSNPEVASLLAAASQRPPPTWSDAAEVAAGVYRKFLSA
jgi:glycosyltransferase involved in cell wall biosynthesis